MSPWTIALARWAEQELGGESPQPLLSRALPAMERVLIRTVLAHTDGKRQEAAQLLGWGRNTLTRKIKELGLDGED
jgi:two-component system nitrogen regulation response regulator GlnG